ncbi:MAG: hypothetical protein F6J95_033600 [Leptolyngbya sp. SIO1E4]|nr:hypothetical protein [Leptolyngbya sp. SIO1E4]
MTETVLYQPQSDDTPVAADRRFFQRLRQQPVSLRVAQVAQHTRSINALCLSGIKRRSPNAPLAEIREKFAIAKLKTLPAGLTLVGEDETMWVQDSITLAQTLDRLFAGHEILYYVTGGVAASTHGEPRSTIDLDLVVQISSSDVEELADILTHQGFYCPHGAVDEVKRGIRNSFQATHQVSIASVDIYLSDNSDFAISQMTRRLRLDEGFYVASAEDTVLQKLRWRQSSQSEKQWRDVLGILKLQPANLDYAYLEQWADALGVASDLTAARQAASYPEE